MPAKPSTISRFNGLPRGGKPLKRLALGGSSSTGLNTCEWDNGPHVLFATASVATGLGGVPDSGPIATSHGVSAYVSPFFNNLVARVAFSQPHFIPGPGQTQQVTAAFPFNSDWTLKIVDISSNIVRTASGSGMDMKFDWDGTDNSGADLPNGIFYYYVTVHTNGLPEPQESAQAATGDTSSVAQLWTAPSSSGTGVSPVPFLAPTEQLWAAPLDGSGSAAPLSIYPPGLDLNQMEIFSAPALPAKAAPLANPQGAMSIQSLSAPLAGGTSGGKGIAAKSRPVPVTPLPGDPQPSPTTPERPPNSPAKGLMGTFGIAYDTYTANGTNKMMAPLLKNGLVGNIMMNNASSNLYCGPLPQYQATANNFVTEMQHWGWTNQFNKADDALNISEMRGSSAIFNSVNIGVFLGHGAYGTGTSGTDYAASSCLQMYFPITAGSQITWLRLSEMKLGGSGSGGLKWMVLHACNSLQHDSWANMQSKFVRPYNGNLHLLLGCDTVSRAAPNFLKLWARYINYGTAINPGFPNPMTLCAAWYQAAEDDFKNYSFPETIVFAVAGDSACMGDTLQNNSEPSGGWTYDSKIVYTVDKNESN